MDEDGDDDDAVVLCVSTIAISLAFHLDDDGVRRRLEGEAHKITSELRRKTHEYCIRFYNIYIFEEREKRMKLNRIKSLTLNFHWKIFLKHWFCHSLSFISSR